MQNTRALSHAMSLDDSTQDIPLHARILQIDGGTSSPSKYLPDAVDAAGLIFTIILATITSGSVTIVTQTGSDEFYLSDGTTPTSFTMSAAEDYVVLYSDGVVWYELVGTRT